MIDIHNTSYDVDLELRLALLERIMLEANDYGDQVTKINLHPCYQLTIKLSIQM